MNTAAAFQLLTGYPILRWQQRLLSRLLADDIPDRLSLPTGLGKTSTIALWLIARSVQPRLPRRLVYIVDRRVVVDQASREAEALSERLGPEATDPLLRALRQGLGLAPGQRLAVSPLRGGLADNAAWRVDPAAPAIIVGTVDMIGSRLLFEGYGVGRRMRPLQAGLLGCDCLVILDEAHLVPPFAALLRRIAADPALRGSAGGHPLRSLRLLTLSATGGDAPGQCFGL
ncbi:MAG: type I-U CRISPR-associated helicase/endonuclease Cas3 [Rhodovarius sp.]|nr:type I-U CRISPR-associated helicase/endonuclease Cas3 [Rhodovarius sp.]